MKSFSVNTTMHCSSCVDQVKKHLHKDSRIQKWTSSQHEGIKLHIEGSISLNELNALLQKEGYEIKSQNSFWADKKKWKRASFNTLNCLIGCSIGDFGMIIFLQTYHPGTEMWLQMILAIVAGLFTSILLETILLKTREQFGWTLSLKTAFGMSFISMVAMELAMTSTDFMITQGKMSVGDLAYWMALIPALAVGFLVPLPYNYYKLKKFNQSCH